MAARLPLLLIVAGMLAALGLAFNISLGDPNSGGHARAAGIAPGSAGNAASFGVCDTSDVDADSDGDALNNGDELAVGTDPCIPDTDGDHCADGLELQPLVELGGERAPTDAWDFYDVSGDSLIDLSDTLTILGDFGEEPGSPDYDPSLDRDIADAQQPWRTEASADGIDLTDALVNLQSFGHQCDLTFWYQQPTRTPTVRPSTATAAASTSTPHTATATTGIATSVPTFTATPTATKTHTATATATATRTNTPTATQTTSIATATFTASATSTNTATRTATVTPSTPTATATCGPSGLIKTIDGAPPPNVCGGQDSFARNLWLCYDQSDDNIDNNGDSTVDNEVPTCLNHGEGYLDIIERIYTSLDCDSRNDDDDNDGKPVSNDPGSPGYRPECPNPTVGDYNANLVDKDGGELPEGLGAFEFQLKFDHKIFDISISPLPDWANGRTINCSMTIITENDIRFVCITVGPPPLGIPQATGQRAALIHVLPEPDLRYRIRASKDNGTVRRLLDENCQVADVLGDIFPNTFAGLTYDCTDIDITVRRLEGDLDLDCDVDMVDYQRMIEKYNAFFGSLRYDQAYDLEPWPWGDFDIDAKDVQFVAGRVGSTCANPIPDNQDPVPATGVGQP